MRYAKASALAPLLRSDLTGSLLAEVFLNGSTGLSMAELARRTGGAYSGVHREMSRFETAGFVLSRRDGRNVLMSANPEHPMHGVLLELLTWAYGPEPVLRSLVAQVDGVEYAAIYGSWAAQRNGVAGPPPDDVDVLLIGTISRRNGARLAAEASEQLRRTVNVTILRPDEWSADTPFTRSIRSRPLVELT